MSLFAVGNHCHCTVRFNKMPSENGVRTALWLRVQHACDEGFFFALHIGDFDLNAVARGNIDRLAFAGHLFQFDGLVAARVDDFERIADGEAVFNFDGRPAIFVDFGNVSDVLALFGGGMAAEVVLIILSLVAFEEAAGVASVGKAFEFAQQAVIKRTACDGIVNRFAVGLGDAGDVVETWYGLRL